MFYFFRSDISHLVYRVRSTLAQNVNGVKIYGRHFIMLTLYRMLISFHFICNMHASRTSLAES